MSTASSLVSIDFLTVNEKRAKLGYPPVPFGDRLTQSMGKQPLDTQIVTSDAQTLMNYDPKLLQAIIAQADEAAMQQAEKSSRDLAVKMIASVVSEIKSQKRLTH
jgi:hypothetical protein